MVVVTDNNQTLAQQTATTLGEWVWDNRDALLAPFVSPADAIARTLQAPPDKAPIVIADTADNTGIGAAGDSTFLLQALIDRGVGGYAISPLWDPGAVGLAFEAGLGASLAMRIGGKLGPASGAPVDTTVTVMGLKRNGKQMFGGGSASLGDMAWLRIGDADDDERAIDVVCNTHRVQAFHPDCFAQVGLDDISAALQIHLSIGISIGVVIVLRIIWRLINKPPEFEPGTRFQHFAAHFGHYVLYAIMIIMPLTGYLGTDVGTHFFLVLSWNESRG